jgi:GT2 family glycosyltransferase
MAGGPPVVISVVIPVRDAAGVLAGQLGALAAQQVDEPWEVIVADNGSTDDPAAVVAAWKGRVPGLRMVDASDRPGVSHARNAGARAARGDRLLFCDADDEASAHWVAAMGAALRHCAAVGGRLDRRRLSPARAWRSELAVSDDLVPWPGFWPFASGANCGVRADVFAAIGGFDESFRGGGDDVAFSWRLRQLGHDLRFVPEAVVHYRERRGWRAAARQAYGYGRQDPRLYGQFARAGMPPSGWRRAARSWGHLVVYAPRYWRSAPGRARWVRSVARRAGRLAGSVELRTRYL